MAYAAVISLKHTIERLINPKTIESAYEELDLLGNTLRRLDGSSHKSIDRSVISALDAQIREAVWKLEDAIESYALRHSLPASQGLDQEGVDQEMDSFLKTVKKLGEEYRSELDQPSAGEEEGNTVYGSGGNESTSVGLSDQLGKLRNELMNLQSERKSVSLLGMAGIGKTHLAREIFQHPTSVQRFDVRAWASIGPKDQLKNGLVDILSQIERKPRNLYMDENMVTLRKLLRENLRGRRYLIVLDDIWSTRIYDEWMIWHLPDDGNRSRLLVTTRLEEVAKYSTSIHQMRFLNNEESWELLRQNVFGGKSVPPQLERVGRKIAENCEGLPLLILAVANILGGLEKTEEYWKKVAEKKTRTFTDAYDQISKVLSLSYEYLPQHLKPCFLYMGVFPQSFEIPSSKLINLWTVEDFLDEPICAQTLDETAMECLEKLVSNSLVIVCKQSYNHTIKAAKLHSAYWHLCVTEARNNKFFHVLNKLTDASKDYIGRPRHLSVQNNILFGIKEVYDSMAATLTARSLLCTGPDHEYPVPICFNLLLLKVLDALAIRFYEFPGEVVKLLQLRYLALTHNGKLPSSISNLQELQCLIIRQHHNIKLVRDRTCLPEEIWDMQELRHLRIMGSNLPDPRHGAWLPNLLTLDANAHSCTKAVFRGMGRLKKLGIKIELQPDTAETLSCFKHIGHLSRLDSLKCVVVNPRLRSGVVAPPDDLSNLPWGLKKLSLNGLGYAWEKMSIIGSLPNLKVLKLRCSAFEGAEWKTNDRGFRSLEFLLLEDIDLVQWIAGEDLSRLRWGRSSKHPCFQRLQCLTIRHCYKLKEIPWEIGEIPTLKTIELVDCTPSAVASAREIHQEFSVEVVIDSSWNFSKT